MALQAWGLEFMGPPPPAGAAAVLAGVLILAAFQVRAAHPTRSQQPKFTIHSPLQGAKVDDHWSAMLADPLRNRGRRGQQPD